MNEQIFYHFLCSKNAIEDLDKERIKVSLINELNDPFELLPYLRYNDPNKRKNYHKIRREVSKKHGLLCFSRTWNEPLLWGHYANQHKGIALGFEILKDEIIEVDYDSEPKRTKFELKNNSVENEKLFLCLAKIKYEKWSYEEEYRIFVKLDECKKELIKDKQYFFADFKGRLKVKDIILGCKFDNEKELTRLKELAEALDANIIATRQGWEDYKIRKCGTKTKKLQHKK